MKNIIVQIYEVQDPLEAESLVEIGVDRIGAPELLLEHGADTVVSDLRQVRTGG